MHVRERARHAIGDGESWSKSNGCTHNVRVTSDVDRSVAGSATVGEAEVVVLGDLADAKLGCSLMRDTLHVLAHLLACLAVPRARRQNLQRDCPSASAHSVSLTHKLTGNLRYKFTVLQCL